LFDRKYKTSYTRNSDSISRKYELCITINQRNAYTTGSQKVPGNVVYQCSGWTYDNAYLITFKVGPLRTHTLAPSILPLLEAPAEGFFWNLLQFGRRIPFDVLHGCETRPLVAHFQSREQPKVTRSKIRRIRWLGVDRNAFLGEELLHNKRFLAEKSIPVITQTPYSSDLAPSDFWLFPTLKMGLKGTRFATMENIKWNATTELQKIPKEAFRRCFQQWQDRWSKCVCAQGSYFEGD